MENLLTKQNNRPFNVLCVQQPQAGATRKQTVTLWRHRKFDACPVGAEIIASARDKNQTQNHAKKNINNSNNFLLLKIKVMRKNLSNLNRNKRKIFTSNLFNASDFLVFLTAFVRVRYFSIEYSAAHDSQSRWYLSKNPPKGRSCLLV